MTPEDLRKIAAEKYEQASKLNEIGVRQSGNSYFWHMSRAHALRSEAQALLFQATKLEEADERNAKEEPRGT